nr:putative reverse transcriptase domain-containing protein [Tanacetum cinerariifolium]
AEEQEEAFGTLKHMLYKNEVPKEENIEVKKLYNVDKKFEVWFEGVRYLKGRAWILNVDNLPEVILDEAHRSRYLIHPGADKMYQDVKEYYWWPDMKKDIALYLENTSNALHNAIMEAGGKDRPPMLASGESINVQDLKTNLYWEFGKFTSRDGESLDSYYSRFYKMMNELVRNQCDVTNHQVNVQFLLQLQPEWQSNLRTSSNTSRENQDNSPRINRGTGYDNQRIVNVSGARENVARECHKPKWAKDAAYHKEKMILCKQEEAGFQLNAEQAE